MSVRFLAVAAALLTAGLTVVPSAVAQVKVYVIDEAAIRAGSKIGKDIQAKLGEIEKQGVEQLGLKSLADQIKAEETALQPQLQSMADEQGRVQLESLNANPTLKSRVESLSQKQTELAQKSSALNQGLSQQSNAAVAAFGAALGPAVAYVAEQEGADIIVSSSSVWHFSDAADLSDKVIARLDATTPTLASIQAAAPPVQ